MNPFRKASSLKHGRDQNNNPLFQNSRKTTTINTNYNNDNNNNALLNARSKNNEHGKHFSNAPKLKKKKNGNNGGKNILSFFKPKKKLSTTTSTSKNEKNKISKAKQTSFIINTNVVGCQFHQNGIAFFQKNKTAECTLLREPTNRFDKNAILVLLNCGTIDLGHVPRSEASYLATFLDQNNDDDNNNNSTTNITNDNEITIEASIPIASMRPNDFMKSSFPLTITVNIPSHLQNDINKIYQNAFDKMKDSITKLNKRLEKKVNLRNAKKNRIKGPQQQSLHKFASNNGNVKIPPPTKDSTLAFESIPDVLLRYIFLSDDFTLRDFVNCKLVCKRWFEVISDDSYLKFFFAFYSLNVNLKGNMSYGITYLNNIYNDCDGDNSSANNYDNNNSFLANIHSTKSIWSHGIPLNIVDLFKFVTHKFSKKVTFSKTDVLHMFNDVPILKNEVHLIHLATDGLSALTAVLIFSEPEVVHYLVSFLFNRKYYYMTYDNIKVYNSIKNIIRNFGNTNTYKYEWIYSILVIFFNPYDLNHQIKYVDDESHIISGNEAWVDRGEIILSSLRTANATTFNNTSNKNDTNTSNASICKKTKRRLTGEQQNIVWAKLHKSDLIAVNAFAGTGKTTTLVQFASIRPAKKILYLVFNVSIRLEASKIFPANTDVKSFHALAYSKCGFRYARKLKPELKVSMVMAHRKILKLPKESQTPTLYKAIVETIDNFCNSADTKLNSSHIPSYVAHDSAASVLSSCILFFHEMKSRDSDVPMTHAGYLKLYAMSSPRLDDIYDIIMVDEAQDINPVIASIVLAQTNAPKIIVGDVHQSIYSFSGSRNILENIAATKVFCLTQCFRFGWKISSIANVLLRNFTSEKKRIAGMNNFHNKSIISFCAANVADWYIWDKYERKHPIKDKCFVRYTIVARTNQTLWNIALHLLDRKIPFIFIGGVRGYNLQRCIDIAKFLGGDSKVKQTNKFLAMFKTPNDFHKFAIETGDSELIRCWNTCLQYGADTVIDRFNAVIKISEENEKCNNLIHDVVGLGTVHKVKGLEFDCVLLANDFIDLRESEAIAGVRSGQRGSIDEFNMLYVAITRARMQLRLSHTLYAYIFATSRSYQQINFSLNADVKNSKDIKCVCCKSKCLWSLTDKTDIDHENMSKCNILCEVSRSIISNGDNHNNIIDKNKYVCIKCASEHSNDFVKAMKWFACSSNKLS
jgi:F-box protein, helicase, 18